MKKMLLMLAAGLFSTAWVVAQDLQGVCGSTFDATQKERLFANQEALRHPQHIAERGAIQYVPVYFHLVGDATGAGKVKEIRVLDQLCKLNEDYAPMDMRFYLSPHPTLGTLFDYSINSTNVYSNQTATSTMQAKFHNKAMNVYIVDEAGSSSGGGTTLAYYSPQRDWVVARRDKINGNSSNSVLTHEFGHFFSLPHTFNGWESDPFTNTDSSWPVAPPFSPNGVPTEKADGSNCGTAGDYICDTPPDYNFGYGYSGCNYTDGAKDPAGAVVDPMENNTMGYFLDCTAHQFTQDQQDLIVTDLASSKRNYLDNTFAPITTEINTPTDLLKSPDAGASVPYYDEVLLEWDQVAGAKYYLLEVDIVNSYVSPNAQAFILTNTSKVLTNLLANRTYYWRVRPFNEYVTCAATRQRSFKTPQTSATRQIEGLTACQLAPNPVREGNTVALLLQSEKNFEANLVILDATGRQVYAQHGLAISSGDSSVEIPLESLQNGLYFLTLQTREGQAVRKLSVLR